MLIESIQVGKSKAIEHLGREIKTAIFKYPVEGKVFLKTLSLEGDEQADLRVHGGLDKALYAYPSDVYAEWRKLRPNDDFSNGAMGENLSMSTLPESEICVGDTYRIGEAIVQVTQPRFPCHKLGLKYKDMNILGDFMKLGRPGVYYRVLKEGLISKGQAMSILDREKIRFSILEFFNFKKDQAPDKSRLREIVSIEALPKKWRAKFQLALKD